ncbi:MAG: hypothetical protein BMS9Abin34_536 [Patescibacteria group bacterium]|nr:MAG: hypothetical protein BMS9Abin34_536 [Patescibacteria group bacterium]
MDYQLGKSSAKKGFSFVELVLSVGLVLILVGVAVLAVNPLERLKQGRDKKRLADFAQVKAAVDAALSEGSSLATTFDVPSSTVGVEVTTKTDGSGWVSINLGDGIAELPVDPLNGKTYTDVLGSSVLGEYQFISDGTYYILRTHLEAEVNKRRYAEDGNDNSWYEAGSAPGMSTYFGL